ncbi:MAG: hypothetical protein D6768_10315 [Chloroflexi bacterium]|nr:MAG: hypothetical protein D6768_10315 [Chloroflexota bacterium]
MEVRSPARRPFGVIVIILLQILSLGSMILDIYVISDVKTVIPALPGTLELVLLPVPLVGLLIYQVIVIAGLWFLRRWAWFLLMIQLGLAMSFQLLLYLAGTPLYLYMFFSVLMVFYLNQRDVQRVFARRFQIEEPA